MTPEELEDLRVKARRECGICGTMIALPPGRYYFDQYWEHDPGCQCPESRTIFRGFYCPSCSVELDAELERNPDGPTWNTVKARHEKERANDGT